MENRFRSVARRSFLARLSSTCSRLGLAFAMSYLLSTCASKDQGYEGQGTSSVAQAALPTPNLGVTDTPLQKTRRPVQRLTQPAQSLAVRPSPTTPAPSVRSAVRPQPQPQPTVPSVVVPPVVPGSAGVVALTFDDGPHPTRTKQLLDILRRENVVATFYVVGRSLEANQGLLNRMVNEGHELGNHTWDHPDLVRLSRSKGMEAVKSQLRRSQEKIVELTGQTPRTFRPPYGAINQSIREVVGNEFGMDTTMWTVDPQDWRKPGVQVVTNRVVSRARPNGILLLHDIHQSTIDSVPGIISGLKAKGYGFVTVSDLQRRVAAEKAQQEQEAALLAEQKSKLVEELEILEPLVLEPEDELIIAPNFLQSPAQSTQNKTSSE